MRTTQDTVLYGDCPPDDYPPDTDPDAYPTPSVLVTAGYALGFITGAAIMGLLWWVIS